MADKQMRAAAGNAVRVRTLATFCRELFRVVCFGRKESPPVDDNRSVCERCAQPADRRIGHVKHHERTQHVVGHADIQPAGRCLGHLARHDTERDGFSNSIFNQPVGVWDTSNVTRLDKMHHGNAVFNQPIGAWGTSGVTAMHSAVLHDAAFSQTLPLWDTLGIAAVAWRMLGRLGRLREDLLSRARYSALCCRYRGQAPATPSMPP